MSPKSGRHAAKYDRSAFAEASLLRDKAHELVRHGDITYKGDRSKCPVINPSGGLISKGYPLGATGLAQCAELCWQLRGWANNRHVPSRVALQHNLGLGGCVVVSVYKRADGKESVVLGDDEVVKGTRWSYNPATNARTPTMEEAETVRSKKFKNEYALGDTPEKMRSRL